MKQLLKKVMIWFMWHPLRLLIKVLPHKTIHQIGVAGGRLLCSISRDKRRIMAQELSLIFPDKSGKEIREIITGSFINYVVSELEVLLYPSMNYEYISKMVTIEGKWHLDRSLSKGKGVLLFQAHFGAFQMVMPAIGYNGYRMNQISASAAIWKEDMCSRIQKKSFDIKAEYEYTLPVQHISIKSSIRPVFRALERNEIVGITIDGGGGKKVLPIEFLGRKANIQTGAAAIAIKTGAEIVPAFIITEKGLKHKLVIHPPLLVAESQDQDGKMRKILTEFVKILEEYVKRYPDHYGYTSYLRKSREAVDPYPFFVENEQINNNLSLRYGEL